MADLGFCPAVAIVFAVLGLAACSKETSAPEDSAVQTVPSSLFAARIAPLLAANCATCHLTGEEAGHISLIPDKAIASLVGVMASEAPALTRVVPHDPDGSYLIMKLEGTQIAHGGTGARMPFGTAPLPPEEIALIRQWIKEGAKP